MSKQIDENRFFSMAQTYDKMCRLLVPHYELMQNEVFNIIDLKENDKITVADLGAGSGIFLEKFLERYENIHCYWIDYSDDFRKIAEKRLLKYKDKVTFINSKIEDNWEDKIIEKIDVIVSMSAIHHLETIEKKQLYVRCFDKLNLGGWFFNIDEMKSLNHEAYKEDMNYWNDFVEKCGKKIDPDNKVYYDQWMEHFNGWKVRNIDNINVTKQKGDDLHDTFTMQVEWLYDIGFKNANLFMKYRLWNLIGGKKG